MIRERGGMDEPVRPSQRSSGFEFGQHRCVAKIRMLRAQLTHLRILVESPTGPAHPSTDAAGGDRQAMSRWCSIERSGA